MKTKKEIKYNSDGDNKKSKPFLFLMIILIAGLSSCKKVNADKGKKSNHIVTVHEDFASVDFGIGGNVSIVQSSQTSVQINTTDKVFSVLDIYVKDSMLKIETKNGYKIKNSDEIQVNITAPNVHHFTNSGAGQMTVNMDEANFYNNSDITLSGSGGIQVDYMNALEQIISLSGSGSISVGQVVSNATASMISGSGSITLSGSADNSDINISGSGSFNGFALLTDITDINISSSGSCQVYADSLLNVQISGSGSVKYKGYPIINTGGSGNGSVINAN